MSCWRYLVYGFLARIAVFRLKTFKNYSKNMAAACSCSCRCSSSSEPALLSPIPVSLSPPPSPPSICFFAGRVAGLPGRVRPRGLAPPRLPPRAGALESEFVCRPPVVASSLLPLGLAGFALAPCWPVQPLGLRCPCSASFTYRLYGPRRGVCFSPRVPCSVAATASCCLCVCRFACRCWEGLSFCAGASGLAVC